jgi:hypothetical protein
MEPLAFPRPSRSERAERLPYPLERTIYSSDEKAAEVNRNVDWEDFAGAV